MSSAQGQGSIRVGIVEFHALEDRTLLLALTPDRADPFVVELDMTRRTLKSLGDRIVADFSAGNINPAHPEWSTDLAYLDESMRPLVSVVIPLLDRIDAVAFIPHRDVFHIPLHALRLDDGSYLIERKAVFYAPSAALMADAWSRRSGRRPRSFVGLGTGAPADPLRLRQSFEEEVRDVERMVQWEERRALTGAEATRAALVDAPGADVWHVACHGFFEHDDPLNSGLLLAGTEAASGARPGERSEEAGQRVTAREIAGLRLGANLVYLSACVSGRHDTRPGDEILGMTRALIRAEAASIVVSLWPVAGAGSTRLLVEEFYRNWLERDLGKAEALRAAQITVMATYPHPYHWAPFVLFGDWV
jgi:CHAT domain-containing protein